MRLFALQGQTLFAPRFRSAQPWAHAHNPAPPRGVGDAAPYNTIRRVSHYRKRPRRPVGRPPYIPLYHIPWGGPSPATHSRHPVGAGHARPAASPLPPLIPCIVGRGFDRLTAHNERRQPAKLARSCGCLPCRGKHCSLPISLRSTVGPRSQPRTSAGVGDAAPYNTIRRASHYRKRPRRPGGRPPYIPLYHIPWGGPSPATHSRHPVGAGHARPAALPLPLLLSFAS